jgi:hypothetical protein
VAFNLVANSGMGVALPWTEAGLITGDP